MIINNYKEMCLLLGEKYCNGKSKTYQVDNWHRFFSFDKNGHKYIITGVHETPLPQSDKKAELSIYTKLIELLLMYELSQKKESNYTCHYTKTFLFYILGMVNQRFLNQQRQPELNNLLEENKIQNWQFNNFYVRTQNKLTRVLFSALNSMSRRKLLDYSEQRVIIDINDKEGKRRIATPEEKELILALENKVLTEEFYRDTVPFQFWERKKYYDAVSDRLQDIYGWKSFKEYELVFLQDEILRDIPKVKSEIMRLIRQNQLSMNSKIVEFLNEQAEKHYIANCNKYEEWEQGQAIKLITGEENCCNDIEEIWGEHTNIGDKNKKKQDGEPFKFHSNYIEKQELLVDLFISL